MTVLDVCPGKDGQGGAAHKNKNKVVCRLASSLWGFSSAEVFLIGIYLVESKFDKFVSALAGNDNAQFFSVQSSLGPAFAILIVYESFSDSC